MVHVFNNSEVKYNISNFSLTNNKNRFIISLTERRSVNENGGIYNMHKNAKPPEERRQELIDVASMLFFKNGYEATSVRDILKEVNGAPGMFYYYFTSKEDIFKAVVEQYVERYIANLNTVLLDKNTAVEKRIKGALEEFSRTFERLSPFFSNPKNPANDYFRLYLSTKIANSLIVPFSQILYDAFECKMIDDKKIKKEDIPQTAYFLVCELYGIMNLNYVNDTYVKNRYEQVVTFISRFLEIPIEFF
jgi:AcrR family transcriptional regulator